jgi:hypothetical protein
LGCPRADEQVGAEHPTVLGELHGAAGSVEALDARRTGLERFLGETRRARTRRA